MENYLLFDFAMGAFDKVKYACVRSVLAQQTFYAQA